LGKAFWTGLIDWMRVRPLAEGLMGAADFDHIQIVDSPREAYEIISNHHREFRKTNPFVA
jgi:predicted Rossmann-fold nucleotide-binding protein